MEHILQVFLVGSSSSWPQKPDCRPRVTAAGEGQESKGTAKPLLRADTRLLGSAWNIPSAG